MRHPGDLTHDLANSTRQYLGDLKVENEALRQLAALLQDEKHALAHRLRGVEQPHRILTDRCAKVERKTHPPDLISMDVQLPVMDGFEVGRRIREHGAPKATPIIMVTTRDEAASAMEGCAAGCDDCIVKPFDRAILLARLEEHLNVSRTIPLTKPGDP